ncbi:MAG: hypothetical protein V4773_04590 [Verrucomicrobiota bacterium]
MSLEHAAWLTLRNAGVAAVRDGSVDGSSANRKHLGFVEFKFTRMPSFEVNETFEIARIYSQAQTPNTYGIIRTRWRIDLDSERADPLTLLRNAQPLTPTLEIETRPFSVERRDALRAEIGTLQIPLSLDLGYGLDGTFYELRVGSSFTHVTVGWWEKPPKGWEKGAELFHRTCDELALDFA